MTKRLVIAEKPSVGASIASVLGVKDRKDGYFEGNDYIVSWGFGHLAELANADTYDEKYAKWRYDDLPIIPAKAYIAFSMSSIRRILRGTASLSATSWR